MSKSRRLIIATVIAIGAVTTSAPALAATPTIDTTATSISNSPAAGASAIWDW